jgi:hypothetical protein
MKTLITIISLASILLLTAPAEEKPPEPKIDLPQTENVQSYISQYDFVVDICIYEQEWIPDEHKATLIQRAVITAVHKGDVPIGTKIQYEHYIEDPPKFFDNFRSVVKGELKVFFFSREDSTLKDGKYTIEGDAHFGFTRLNNQSDSDFTEAFHQELKTNPALQPKPATKE